MGWFSSWDKEGGATVQLAGRDLMLAFKQKSLGIKRKPTEDSNTSSCGEGPRSRTLLGNGYKRLGSERTSGKAGPSLPGDKSRELLMQHDPVGLALKIPLGRTVAAISICLINW